MLYVMTVKDQVLTLHLSGRMTFRDHAAARAMIRKLVEAEAHCVIIDTSALTFIDTAGVDMLLIAQEELRRVGTRTLLDDARGIVQRVFRTVHIDQVFDGELTVRAMPERNVVSGASPM